MAFLKIKGKKFTGLFHYVGDMPKKVPKKTGIGEPIDGGT